MSTHLNGLAGRLVTGAASLLGIGLAFVVLNVALEKGQDRWHRADEARLVTMTRDLEAERSVVETGRQTLSEMSTQLLALEERLAALGSQADSLELKHPRGMPRSVHGRYLGVIDEFNRTVEAVNAVRDRVRAALAEQTARVQAFNQRVDEANALASQTGRRWYIIPVPGRSRRSRGAARASGHDPAISHLLNRPRAAPAR